MNELQFLSTLLELIEDGLRRCSKWEAKRKGIEACYRQDLESMKYEVEKRLRRYERSPFVPSDYVPIIPDNAQLVDLINFDRLAASLR